MHLSVCLPDLLLLIAGRLAGWLAGLQMSFTIYWLCGCVVALMAKLVCLNCLPVCLVLPVCLPSSLSLTPFISVYNTLARLHFLSLSFIHNNCIFLSYFKGILLAHLHPLSHCLFQHTISLSFFLLRMCMNIYKYVCICE